MLRIAATQLPTNLEVRALPEAAKVARQLNRLEAGRQQFHQDRQASVIDTRCLLHAETLLQPHTQHRSLSPDTVIQADAAARGNLNVRGSQALYLQLQVVGNESPQSTA